jgi:uncharacterized protein YneF (UPF0154 family)
MADKQALNATFFAFRKREKSVLLPTTIAYAALTLAMLALFAWLNWQGVVDYIAWVTSLSTSPPVPDPNDPNAFSQMMPPPSVMALGPSYLLFILVAYILFAAYEAACLRWMIHGETGGIFGLSLGADTWRVYFGYWIWFFIGVAAYIAIVVVMFATMGGVLVAAQGNPDSAGPGALVGFAVMLVALLAWLYVAVRLAPAAATSVARRRFSFFDAWKVTKGRFWAVFGAFLLLFIMYLVLCIIMGVGVGVFMGTMAMGQMGQPDPQTPEEALRALASPPILIGLALMYGVMIVAAFTLYVAMFGVNARAAQAALEEGKIAPAS